MFTGIITDVGEVRRIRRNGDTRVEIATRYDTAGLALGASIACSGVCLTVTGAAPGRFAVTASEETCGRTTVGQWHEGTAVNLERALRMGEELGGHLVSGHVDGVGTVLATAAVKESRKVVIEAPADLVRFFAVKGSVAVDGVSLTVNEVSGRSFAVNLIPHTLAATTFDALRAGDRVNLEIDMIARYVARLLETDPADKD